MKALRPILSAVPPLLLAWSMAAQAPAARVPPKVSLAADEAQIEAERRELRSDVSAEFRLFRDRVEETEFITDTAVADYALDGVTVTEYPRGRVPLLTLKAKFRAGRKSHPVETEPVRANTDASAESAVYQVIERSLLDRSFGLYLPAEMTSCRADFPIVYMTLSPRHGGALQKKVFIYSLGLWTQVDGKPGWKVVGPRLRFLGTEASLAKFRVLESGRGAMRFREVRCVARPDERLAVVPRLDVVNTGDVNRNVGNGSRGPG